MSDESASAGAGDYLRAALPGAFRGSVAAMAVLAALAAVVLIGLAIGLHLSTKGRAGLGGAGLIVWGHGAVWLVTGELQRLDSGLADLAGSTWWVFLGLWGTPLAVAWCVAGAVL